MSDLCKICDKDMSDYSVKMGWGICENCYETFFNLCPCSMDELWDYMDRYIVIRREWEKKFSKMVRGELGLR